MIKHKELYDVILDFRIKYGGRKFNDDDNMNAYRNLVDISIKCGLIPQDVTEMNILHILN